MWSIPLQQILPRHHASLLLHHLHHRPLQSPHLPGPHRLAPQIAVPRQ